jgi:hypothetical protein
MTNQRKDVFTIIDKGEGQKSFWVKIGAAFVNKDGSLTVKLDALPMNGQLQIRELREERSDTNGGGGPARRGGGTWVEGE